MNICTFDVDGTLVVGAKGHQASFAIAFKQVYGVDTNVNILPHEGMTDQDIIIKVLKLNGLTEKQILPKLNECMAVMVKSYTPSNDIRVLPGVPAALEALSKHAILGLVTGNLEPIAHKKLGSVGLDKYFKVGGFGSDHIDRATLVKLARKRAEAFGKIEKAFHVGDAPTDMRAAKAAGATAIGVLTSIFKKSQLEEAGADIVLNDLRDIKTLQRIIIGE